MAKKHSHIGIFVYMDQALKDALTQLAEEDDRTPAKYCKRVLALHVKELEEQEEDKGYDGPAISPAEL